MPLVACPQGQRSTIDNSTKIILDLCRGTGAWSKPYRDAGYDVRVLDIKEGCDVRLLQFSKNVYGILAEPPCTVFSLAGNRWPRTRFELRDALSIVDACLRIIAACKPKFWALENPVEKLAHYLGQPRLIFNPCDFSEPYTKKTALWGEFNFPKLRPVVPTDGSRMHWKNSRSQKTRNYSRAVRQGVHECEPMNGTILIVSVNAIMGKLKPICTVDN